MSGSPRYRAISPRGCSDLRNIYQCDLCVGRGAVSDVDRGQQRRSLICSIVIGPFHSFRTSSERPGSFGISTAAIRRRYGNLVGRFAAGCLSIILVGSELLAFGQKSEIHSVSADQESAPAQGQKPTTRRGQPDELKQELDAYAIELSKIPADPLVHPDPVAPFVRPIDKVMDLSVQSIHLKFGATYTFLNQYATITPDGVRHDQPSGRLDFTGAWSVYDHETTAGSISLLIRSGTNIGISQQFNLSDRLGSGLYLNCLQGDSDVIERAAARRSPR